MSCGQADSEGGWRGRCSLFFFPLFVFVLRCRPAPSQIGALCSTQQRILAALCDVQVCGVIPPHDPIFVFDLFW